MFLADGFEETEALCPLDLLRRANIDVLTVGVGKKCITGAHGISVTADIGEQEFLQRLDGSGEDDLRGIVLPGGMPGTANLNASPTVRRAIDASHASGAAICAICAAPSILGGLGLLRGRRAVCFPGFEQTLEGAIPGGTRVCRDGNIITAVGMGAALEFGLEIVAFFCGEGEMRRLQSAVLAP